MENSSKEKEKAMQLCSRREYCRKDIYDKIISWGSSPDKAGEIVNFLVENKFVDDRRYTEAYVKDKLRFNKWGRVKIAYMLRMQNIDKKMIADVLSQIDENEYIEILIGELRKKNKSKMSGNAFELKGKLFRFATGRGFEAETINEAISRVTT